MNVTQNQSVHDAAWRFREECLKRAGSLFTPGQSVWTAEGARDLQQRFKDRPDVSGDDFLTKLQRQMGRRGADEERDELGLAPDQTIQLLAEIAYVHVLVNTPDDFGGKAKRALIEPMLAWMERPLAIPADLDAALDQGLAATGISFKTHRPYQLWLIIDFVAAWTQLDEPSRAQLLGNPWDFKAFLFEIPLKAAFAQREALLYLVHPESFEIIVSRDHKRRIYEGFKDRVDADTSDIDQALLQIRRSFEAEMGGEHFDFYRDDIRHQWDGVQPVVAAQEDAVGKRAWLIRSKVADENRIEEWLNTGYCSIGWYGLGALGPDPSRDQIRARLEQVFPDDSPGKITAAVGNLDRFLNKMQVGDLVVCADGSKVYVGTVSSRAAHIPDDPEAYRRDVEWVNPDSPLVRDELSPSAFSKLRTLLTLTDITADRPEFAKAVGLARELQEPQPKAERLQDREVVLAKADHKLAVSLHLPQDFLDEVLESLLEKRQVVFYGPPGTGKTYVAKELAAHLTAGGGLQQIVQFHPSYTYEDFFEGFRPRQGEEGRMGFELVPGPLKELAEAAREDPANPYVLIIDEINRGNLAKVFGELYFLLEYRDETMRLQYSAEQFSLPVNVFIIGTMNTADRSIALVDAAMRRRFYFHAFFPDRYPVDGVLRSWLRDNGLGAEPAKLLAELNRRIDDPDFSIGPSYLMSKNIREGDRLERVWKQAIMPLLEEHFFGEGRDIEATFGLSAVRSSLARSGGPTDPSAETPPDADPTP